MNTLKSLAAALLICGVAFTAQAQDMKETIKVNGNCGTCEKHIETAAKQAGASKAHWDKDTKVLTVNYDASKTSNDAIQKKVASVGYETEKYAADTKAYNKLDECCQYDRKK